MKRFLIFAFLLLALTAFSSQVYAVTITPSTETQWSGITPQNPDSGDIPSIVSYNGSLNELYKADLDKADDGSTIVTEC